jgi:hypothetical protein
MVPRSKGITAVGDSDGGKGKVKGKESGMGIVSAYCARFWLMERWRSRAEEKNRRGIGPLKERHLFRDSIVNSQLNLRMNPY